MLDFKRSPDPCCISEMRRKRRGVEGEEGKVRGE